MRKTREEKAITLIALIITIVVLLILAVVAINAVTGDGIIQHASNAKTEYQEAQAKENGILAYYEQYLNVQKGSGPWKQDGDKIYMTNSEGEPVELKIGDKVEYNELSNGMKTHFIAYTENGGDSESYNQTLTTENLEWRVLGLNDNGQLELISNQPTKSTIYLIGEKGCLNAETILNTTCNELYGKGNGASNARSLNVDDVNKLAGIITEADKTAVTSSYGSYWRFKYDETLKKIVYSEDYNSETKEGTWLATTHTSFKEPGKLEINENNKQSEAEIKYTGQSYVISEKITSSTSDGKLISNLITNGLDYDSEQENNTNVTQWLASNEAVILENNGVFVRFGVLNISQGYLSNRGLWNSYGEPSQNIYTQPFRPVVTLKSDVQILDTDGNGIPNVK